jgi:hypothetical protein
MSRPHDVSSTEKKDETNGEKGRQKPDVHSAPNANFGHYSHEYSPKEVGICQKNSKKGNFVSPIQPVDTLSNRVNLAINNAFGESAKKTVPDSLFVAKSESKWRVLGAEYACLPFFPGACHCCIKKNLLHRSA